MDGAKLGMVWGGWQRGGALTIASSTRRDISAASSGPMARAAAGKREVAIRATWSTLPTRGPKIT